MSSSSGLSWLKLFAPRVDWLGVHTDRGDMGTAFGLDASIAPLDSELGAGAPADAPVPAPWEHRLTRRSGL